MSRKSKRDRGQKLVSVMMLFFFSGFLLIALQGEMEWQGFALAGVVPLLLYIATIWLPRLFSADRLLLAIANFLCALGILVLYVTDKGAGTSRGFQQATYYAVGIGMMAVCTLMIRHVRDWSRLMPLVAILSGGVLAMPLLIGTEYNGATNWIFIGGTSLQPSEIVKIPMLMITAWYLSHHQTWPWLAFGAFSMLILMLQKDLGTALIDYTTVLLMFYASGGSLLWTGVGTLGAGGAAVLGYKMFAHVKKRVAIWRNPWIYYETSGYQIAQMLMAIASGGLFGVGLGLGAPRTIPVYYTDCIFAVICEQFGVIFGVMVLGMYVILILRGFAVARRAPNSFSALLAMGATAMLALQTFIIIGGVLKLIPLTGVTMPFVSYGGTSLVSCMGLIGVIQGVESSTLS